MIKTKILGLIFDMDGVIWRNHQPIGDLDAIFKTIAQKKLRYCFATNNSSQTVSSYVSLLKDFNIPVSGDQIFTSAKATAELLASNYPEKGDLFVVGMSGLEQTLTDFGFTISGNNPVAVVAGIDFEISYEKLKTAALLIRSGAPFYGTNPDKTFPTPEGLVPGAGSLLAALEAASGVPPKIVGKPLPTMFLQAIKFMDLPADQILVVGDRMETDIAGGQAAGCKTAVVLSGVSTLAEAQSWKPSPDIIAADLAELAERL
jgi:4-nitrophenyl phosphatase